MAENSRKTVYVAMSGGVDSSVAAALLKKRGFDVVGVFMKPWQPKGTVCLWEKDREDALRVAAILEIPFLTWDFSKEYKRSVADYMIREYKTGRTPNPDVMCNKEIKLGLFFKRAMVAGADYIATGHYVRLKTYSKSQTRLPARQATNHKKKLSVVSHKLLVARDSAKDQSYFLWTLTPKQLKHCIFPIGDYTKPQVRVLAKKFKRPTAEKKDSQGVCFIGPLDMKEFLTKYIKPKKGPVIAIDDNPTLYAHIRTNKGYKQKGARGRRGIEIGTHDGVCYYTIGQRHGLNLSIAGGPYFVVSKDIKKNIIYVGKEERLGGTGAKVGDFNWIDAPNFPAELDVRVRYRAPLKKAIINKKGEIKFIEPERAITSGQSAVFYRGQEMLGGGIIK